MTSLPATIRPPVSTLAALLVASGGALLLAACGGSPAGEPAAESSPFAAADAPNPLRNAYFGDLHVHTQFSYDAFILGTRATPDDAYRYARGEAISHPSGYQIQLQGGALDFTAVTDHAAFLGMLPAMVDPEREISKLELSQQIATAETRGERIGAFQAMSPYIRTERHKEILDLDIVRSAWQEIIDSAQRNNEPGAFTTFIGYEYTSGPESQNLHRNVIFRGDTAPALPFSRLDSANPEDLWAWLDAARADGMEALAIPHNSNGSNGQMFRLATFDGAPLDAGYAELRMRNEPLVEVTQVKGTSETHPLLSPNDEWAEFEIYPFRIATSIPSDVPGSYVREAYLNGLLMEEQDGFNPFRFGLVGASDTHNAGGPVEESSYYGKAGVGDGTPRARGSIPREGPRTAGDDFGDAMRLDLFGASGLTGVWAEENSRDSLYAALRRKETFATTGPRIRVRFFAGYGYEEGMLEEAGMIRRAYDGGVAMGSDLGAEAEAEPAFLAWAARDAQSAPLQRLQIVKGWVENGSPMEKVFDVACADGLVPDAATSRCPDNGARVDTSDCSISEGVGAAELLALWRDPELDPSRRAFYYVRALENPTCRWSTWDAVRAGVAPKQGLPATIQERAFSSPIWLVPMR